MVVYEDRALVSVACRVALFTVRDVRRFRDHCRDQRICVRNGPTNRGSRQPLAFLFGAVLEDWLLLGFVGSPAAAAPLHVRPHSHHVKPLTIPKDTTVYLGRPAKPMPQELADAIGEMVRGIPGIREAHLPHCYVKGIVEPPTQILVLVFDDAADQQGVLDAVGQGLSRVLPQGAHLDVWPLSEGDILLSDVRNTKMSIHTAPQPDKKPWWKIF